MSRRSSQSYDRFYSDALEPIREDHSTTITIMATPPEKPEPHEDLKEIKKTVRCPCKENLVKRQNIEQELQKMIEMKEEEINEECKKRMDEKIEILKGRFNEILRNEQIRSSYLVRQVYQDEQEKISALRGQLECTNLAALMYVLCSERRRCKIQTMKMKEGASLYYGPIPSSPAFEEEIRAQQWDIIYMEYTNYIKALKEILADSQRVILDLSRGYKTAARVDDEWRRKMKMLIKEFHSFIYNFAGGSPDVNQYFLEIPELLKIEAFTKNDPEEDPCDEMEESIKEEPISEPKEKLWWDDLGEESHPFVVFGDMADFQPSQRREVLRKVKAAKTAPKKWKEYAFNNMFLGDKCNNMANIMNQERPRSKISDVEYLQSETQYSKQCSETSRRVTGMSNGMGSIMKVMASNGTTPAPTSLLAAKDSFEIISATRLREKKRSHGSGNVTLKIGNKIEALFDEINEDLDENLELEEMTEIKKDAEELTEAEETDQVVLLTSLGSVHHDSLQIIPSHIPEEDHVIRYEKICPVDECQRKQVDDFMRSLPPYMQASPHMHYEKTYDEYETCSPEQLKILEKIIEERKRKEKVDFGVMENPLSEWTSSDELAVQTLEMPCTCRTPSPTPASSTRVFTLADIINVKEKVDEIKEEHLFSENIEFNRFQVIGQDDAIPLPENLEKERLSEIKNILKIHPSLCEIFESSVPC